MKKISFCLFVSLLFLAACKVPVRSVYKLHPDNKDYHQFENETIEKGENNGKLLRDAEWPYGGKKEAPVGLVIDKMWGMDIGMRKKSAAERVEARDRIRDQVREIDRHERGAKKAAKEAKIADAIKRRNDAFDEPMGKGKGKVLASIFRIVKEFNSLQWVRKNNAWRTGIGSERSQGRGEEVL